MEALEVIEDKAYKVRKLNVLDIRSIAKILKEIGKTRAELREVLETVVKKSREAKIGKELDKPIIVEGSIESIIDIEEIKAEDYIGSIIQLTDIVLDFLCESDSFWEFIKDITSCDDLSKIPLSEVTNIINELVKDNELANFFTGLSTQKEKQEK